MIGILILTHGELAKGYLSASELISGKAENIDSLGLFHETSIEDFKEDAAKKMQELDQGEGVLVFCDIFGASPYNVTAQNYHVLGKGRLPINYRCEFTNGNRGDLRPRDDGTGRVGTAYSNSW